MSTEPRPPERPAGTPDPETQVSGAAVTSPGVGLSDPKGAAAARGPGSEGGAQPPGDRAGAGEADAAPAGAAGDVSERARQTAAQVASQTRQAADRAREAAGPVADQAREAAEKARAAAGPAVENVRQAAEHPREAAHDAADQARQAAGQLSRTFEERPELAVAAAFAGGLLFAKVLRRLGS